MRLKVIINLPIEFPKSISIFDPMSERIFHGGQAVPLKESSFKIQDKNDGWYRKGCSLAQISVKVVQTGRHKEICRNHYAAAFSSSFS